MRLYWLFGPAVSSYLLQRPWPGIVIPPRLALFAGKDHITHAYTNTLKSRGGANRVAHEPHTHCFSVACFCCGDVRHCNFLRS